MGKSLKNPVFFYLFRHGQTQWNAEGRFQGHEDIPLNEVGKAQAHSLVSCLGRMQIEEIISSDLTRAKQTAQIIATPLRLRIHFHAGLREAHLGQAQGLTRNEIEEKLGTEILNGWKSALPTDADLSYPGGETGSEVMRRVFSALEEWAKKTDKKRIGVSTHGGVLRRMGQKTLPPHSPPLAIPNGIIYAYSHCRITQRWEFLNYLEFNADKRDLTGP